MIIASQTDQERDYWARELTDAQASLDAARANAPKRRARRDRALAQAWLDGVSEQRLCDQAGLAVPALRELIGDLLVADAREDDAYAEEFSERRRMACS